MRVPTAPPTSGARRDVIALVLAIGIVTALNLIVVGVMIAAARRHDYTISENATQILTGWGGGIIGVLGAIFGYEAGRRQTTPPPDQPPDQLGGSDGEV